MASGRVKPKFCEILHGSGIINNIYVKKLANIPDVVENTIFGVQNETGNDRG